MGVKLKLNFGKSIFADAMQRSINNSKKRIAGLLAKVGDDFNQQIEANKGFNNQTFSLISSIGYIVTVDGSVIHQKFIDGGNAEGQQKGLKVAKEAIQKDGIMLICVAGEDYALYVESKGHDVITGSSQIITSTLKQLLDR